MIYPGLVTIFALFLYGWTFFGVGNARKRTGIKAPAVTGNDEFERYFRVQANTVEQLVLFLPAMWLCAEFFRPGVAAILGVVWIAGRIIYALAYYKAANRLPGFLIGQFAALALLLLALWGIGVRLLVS